MLKNILEIFSDLLNLILPLRSNFDIVRKLNPEKIFLLPKAEKVQDCDWIISLFQYKDQKVKAIIWELKYKENILLLGTIGKLIHDEIINIMSDIILFNSNAEFLLIPIPMTDGSKVERGYNQSEYIAKSILENDLQRMLVYAPQWFRKIKETPKQSKSESRTERIKNLENCFEADARVEGKYIFLIDDVVTTGSTLREARKTLLEKGAGDVFAFTIAH